MQIVIDIPEEVLNSIKTFKGKFLCENGYDLIQGIKDGTPLPEGHGRLIDTEKLLNTFWTYCKQGDFGYHQAEDLIRSAHTIVGEDKKYEVKVITRGNCLLCGKELTEGLFFCKECGDEANSRK